jgi:hypothetical protein
MLKKKNQILHTVKISQYLIINVFYVFASGILVLICYQIFILFYFILFYLTGGNRYRKNNTKLQKKKKKCNDKGNPILQLYLC